MSMSEKCLLKSSDIQLRHTQYDDSQMQEANVLR